MSNRISLHHRTWIGILAVLIAFTSFAASVAPASSAAAPQPMTPDYEVKLFLDPSLVLDANHELTPAVRTYFQTGAAEKIRVQFLDTNDQRINQEGWYVRLRKKENDASNKFELVYKKRYPVENGNLNAALAQAARDGFTADDTNYEAQVDWGYAKQTLSISRKKKVKKDGFSGIALPDLPTSRTWAIDEAPGKFVNWSAPQWGVNQLQAVQKLYGPVNATRSSGLWDGDKIDIEVWAIKNEAGTGFDYIVEASFKEADGAAAAAKKAALDADLAQAGWLLPVDQLKTQLILQRY